VRLTLRSKLFLRTFLLSKAPLCAFWRARKPIPCRLSPQSSLTLPEKRLSLD
jgi:hypothetical protein